jgi:hypothetical protein
MRKSLRGAGLLLAAGLLSGAIACSLTRVTFDLPSQTYNFDTSMSGLPAAPAGSTFPTIPCGADGDCCTLAGAAGYTCSSTLMLSCPAGSCEAQVPESTHSSVNLAMQVGQLATFPGHSLVNVSIQSINYTVSNNTLNVDLPPISIYLAPDGVTDPNDPSAELFGTVPPIPAGTNPSGNVQKTSNADAVFEKYTKNVSQTFNIIAAATVVIDGGSPVPNGHITVTVGGTISAQL